MTKGLDKTMTIGCTCTAPRCSMNGFSQRVTSLCFVRPFFGRIILVNLHRRSVSLRLFYLLIPLGNFMFICSATADVRYYGIQGQRTNTDKQSL